MTRWMILTRLIIVIFSAKKILLTSLIWWIKWWIERLHDERLIEHLKIQSKMNAVYLMIEKMKIAVWLIKRLRIAIWLIDMTMIAVWLTRKIVVWLTEIKIVNWLTIFFVQKLNWWLNWSFSNWWFWFSWFRSWLCLSRIIYRIAIKIDFAKLIDDVWFKLFRVIDEFFFDSEDRIFFLKNSS
jgi:hypothetical protein